MNELIIIIEDAFYISTLCPKQLFVDGIKITAFRDNLFEGSIDEGVHDLLIRTFFGYYSTRISLHIKPREKQTLIFQNRYRKYLSLVAGLFVLFGFIHLLSPNLICAGWLAGTIVAAGIIGCLLYDFLNRKKRYVVIRS
jgi:hypothetical protein